jgi:hypothetical protein
MAAEQSVLDALVFEIKKKQAELERIEGLTRIIPNLRADIGALERSRNILLNGTGKEEEKDFHESTIVLQPTLALDAPPPPFAYGWDRKSIWEQVVDVFRAHGDLSAEELTNIMNGSGSTASRHTIMGAIYRTNKEKGKDSPFRKVAPGVFGLKENALSEST